MVTGRAGVATEKWCGCCEGDGSWIEEVGSGCGGEGCSCETGKEGLEGGSEYVRCW